MENLLNNKSQKTYTLAPLSLGEGQGVRSYNNSNSRWLLLLLFSFFIFHFSFAQQGYKKLFTNSATASIFQSVVPQGHSNCMVMTIVNDSVDKKQGIRISRISADGLVQASTYYNTTQYPKTFLYPNSTNACRINDNLFVFSGTGGDSTCGQPGFILIADSNGVVQKFQSIKPAACGSSDCFMWSAQVRYDSFHQQLILGGHTKCSTGMNPYLLKYDTSLNLIWRKTYPSFVYPANLITTILLEKDKYVLCGLADNGCDNYDKCWDTKSVMLAVDTGGTMRWVYTSPASEMRGAVVSANSTPDGGYVYCTMGLGYNRRSTASPTADFYGKQMIVKLDATLKEEWVKVLNTSYSSFSPLININLLKYDDTSFYYRGFKSDSIAPNDNETKNILCKYKMDGTEIWRRYLTTVEPTDTLVGQLYDMEQMQDKSIVIVGMTYNAALNPSQRGFAIRVDSNGCLGADDPQCDPLSIPKQPQLAIEGFKIYPNPSNGNFSISCVVIPKETITAKTYDLLGRVVHQEPLHFSNKEATLKINIPSGSYILELKDEAGNVQRERIVIN
jgi:hypothetical protein